jgi:RNA polymerase-binding transcription factor DksA
MITEAQAAAYRQRLVAMMNRLDGDRAQLKKEALQASGGEPSGNLSNVPIHLADLGTHAFEEEMTLGLVENEEHLMEDIKAAVARLDQGTFGRCAACQKEISKDRLDALPYVGYCVACAAKLQGGPESRVRPST